MAQTHPQIDKTRYTQENGVIAAKDPNRPFPTGNPLQVLKWRLQAADVMPIIGSHIFVITKFTFIS